MARCLFISLFLGLVFYEGVSQTASESYFLENQHYLHIAHTRTSSNPRMDGVAEIIDYSAYDMLWLGGDLTWSTSADEGTMMHVDSIFELGNEHTLWALGNHDYADLNRIQVYSGRPAYYAYHKKGITILVLDTQDSLSHIIGQQKRLFFDVTDTISQSSHLILLHHKLIWMYGDSHLQSQIPYVSNAGLGPSACFSCIHPNNFYSEIYPELIGLERKGIEVICIAGDIGFRSNEFEYLTPEGIQFLASGIEAGVPSNKALVFHHDPGSRELAWKYVMLSKLLGPMDGLPPVLHTISISPDSILKGESIRIFMEAEDPGGAGLDEIKLEILNPGGKQKHAVANQIGDWTSLGNNLYAFDILIADSALSGLWNLSLIHLTDSVGNKLSLNHKDSLLASFMVYDPLGVDVNETMGLSLYPVPGSGIFHIADNPGIASVRVFDQTGRVLRIMQATGNFIDISDVPEGIYFLRMRTSDNQEIIKRVIIIKDYNH